MQEVPGCTQCWLPALTLFSLLSGCICRSSEGLGEAKPKSDLRYFDLMWSHSMSRALLHEYKWFLLFSCVLVLWQMFYPRVIVNDAQAASWASFELVIHLITLPSHADILTGAAAVCDMDAEESHFGVRSQCRTPLLVWGIFSSELRFFQQFPSGLWVFMSWCQSGSNSITSFWFLVELWNANFAHTSFECSRGSMKLAFFSFSPLLH